MAEQMTENKEQDTNQNLNETTQESAAPINTSAAPQTQTAPKTSGLRGMLGGLKDKVASKSGKNVATTENAATQEAETPAAKTQASTEEKDSKTKKTEEEAPSQEAETANPETAGAETENAPQSQGVVAASTNAIAGTPFNQFKTAVQKSDIPAAFKQQLNPSVFASICTRDLAQKETVNNAVKALQAALTSYQSERSFGNRSAQIATLLEQAQIALGGVNAMLGELGSDTAPSAAAQTTALTDYRDTLQNFLTQVQSTQSNLSQSEAALFAGFEQANNLDAIAGLVGDKDFEKAIEANVGKSAAAWEQMQYLNAVAKNQDPMQVFHSFILSPDAIASLKGKTPKKTDVSGKADTPELKGGDFKNIWEIYNNVKAEKAKPADLANALKSTTKSIWGEVAGKFAGENSSVRAALRKAKF